MAVFNKYRDAIPGAAVNIMRPSILGNPFRIGPDGDRDRVVNLHLQYAMNRYMTDPRFAAAVRGLIGKDMVCCCKPKRCHGDNYVLMCTMIQRGEL